MINDIKIYYSDYKIVINVFIHKILMPLQFRQRVFKLFTLNNMKRLLTIIKLSLFYERYAKRQFSFAFE